MTKVMIGITIASVLLVDEKYFGRLRKRRLLNS